jgi:hypothetical protein
MGGSFELSHECRRIITNMICSSCDADVVASKLFRDKGTKREYAIATASVSIKPVRTTISQRTLITS